MVGSHAALIALRSLVCEGCREQGVYEVDPEPNRFLSTNPHVVAPGAATNGAQPRREG